MNCYYSFRSIYQDTDGLHVVARADLADDSQGDVFQFVFADQNVASRDFRSTLAAAASLQFGMVITAQDCNPVVTQIPAMDAGGKTLIKTSGTDTPGVYGRYSAPGFSFNVPAGQTVTHAIEWPFPISIIQGTLYLNGTQSGDAVAFGGPPIVLNDQIVDGASVPVLTAPIVVGEEQITFNPIYLNGFVQTAVIDSGYWEVVVADAGGGNPEPKALVAHYDLESGVVPLAIVKEWNIETEPEPENWKFTMNHGIDARVTVQRWFIPPQDLDGGSGTLPFGGAARGGAPIPQLVPMLIRYTNNGQADKVVRGRLDIGTGVPE